MLRYTTLAINILAQIVNAYVFEQEVRRSNFSLLRVVEFKGVINE